eukprot:Seg1372.14 transcript_id=Seg1372.14/GoldUCD/mRNA.D3Y31 product="DNA-directed RNA polymerase III subunit RPC9" protein_id=Seg1372.14/GoldUCD/D3Y31
MEVTNDSVSMLSNFEVLSLLKETTKGKNQPSNVATISYETIKCLKKMPCNYQSSEVINCFLEAMEPYNLTKAEKLQLLNLRPTSVVELQLIIEELDERLKSEDAIEKLLEVIGTVIPEECAESKDEDKS